MGSKVLIREELLPIIYKILDLCSDDTEEKFVSELLQDEMYHYLDVKTEKPLLDRLWEMEQAIKNQNYIKIQYENSKKKELVTCKIKPVKILFSEGVFQLKAIVEESKNMSQIDFQIDRLKEVWILEEYFSAPYGEQCVGNRS